jgi:hypothetical protein
MALPKLSCMCIAVGLLFVPLLAGCQVDKKKVDEQITTMFKDQLKLTVKKIDCPDKMTISKGAKYECNVDVEPEGTVPVMVEITDNTGSATLSTKYKVIQPDELAADIVKQLEVKGTVDCGKGIKVLKPESSWKCTAKVPSGDHQVDVSITADGTVNYHAE